MFIRSAAWINASACRNFAHWAASPTAPNKPTGARPFPRISAKAFPRSTRRACLPILDSVQRREAVVLERQIPGRSANVGQKFGRPRLGSHGQRRGIDDRQMAFLGEYVAHAPFLVAQGIGRIDD